MKHAPLALLALAVLFGGWFLFKSSTIQAPTYPDQNLDIVAEEEWVQTLIVTNGVARAREVFTTENQKRDPLIQHSAAHVFGEVLYKEKGITAFGECGSEFGFGCVHSFVGFAIAEHGIESLQKLDEACIEMYSTSGLGCFHGIGHGVLAYSGYTKKDLDASLRHCATLSWQGRYGGCTDGVFMEYNFRMMETDEKRQSRAFSEEFPYEPCQSLEGRFQEVCYFSQPEWWRQSLRGVDDSFRTIYQYCAGIVDREHARACFRGIGYAYSAENAFSDTAIVTQCERIPKAEGELWCREGAAWAFYADPALREEVASVCTSNASTEVGARCLDEYLFVIETL